MRKNKTPIIITVVLLLLIIGLFSWKNQVKKQDQSSIEQVERQVEQLALAQYTITEVATHNNLESCWTVIGEKVYDFTTFINRHPGGDKAIIGVCGIDGTTAFAGAHGNSVRKTSELQKFVVGQIKK